MTDDYWFIKREGQGTEVQTLDSTMNIGNLDDIMVFKDSLYKALQIPKSRWDDTMNSVVTIAAPGELTREELHFSKFINRLRTKFKKIFIDFLTTQLELANQIDSKYRRESLFDIEYCEENAFAEQKKLLNLKSKFEVIAMAMSDLATKDNPNGIWTKRFILKEILGMNEEEFQKHQNEIKEEISEQSFDDESEKPTDEIEDEEESEPTISQEKNQRNQEAETEVEKEPTTPEGSKEQIPGEEAGTNQIQLP